MLDVSLAKPGMVYRSGKNFCHSLGLSVAFRQWRATESHCSLIHGYSLQVELEFKTRELDERMWCQDFGGLKEVKEALQKTFDHKLLVAHDDPKISIFKEMAIAKLCELVIMPAVGCEAFARCIYEDLTKLHGLKHLCKVTVREHESNWASYGEDYKGSDYIPASEMRFG